MMMVRIWQPTSLLNIIEKIKINIIHTLLIVFKFILLKQSGNM